MNSPPIDETSSSVLPKMAVAADVSDEFRRLVRDYPFPGKAPLDRDEPSSRRHPAEQRGRSIPKTAIPKTA